MTATDFPLLRDERVIGDFINQIETGCSYWVGTVTQHPCGHSRAADLILPSKRREPRCRKHALDCEEAIEIARRLPGDEDEHAGHKIEWLPESVAA